MPPKLARRIVALKIAKVCSVEIVEQTGATAHQVERAWADYRRANPNVQTVPTGLHSKRRGKGGA